MTKAALQIIAGIIVAAILFVLITLAFGGGAWLTAPFRGAVSEREQTQGSGTYRIAQYDKFFDQCNGIGAAQDNLQLAQAQPGANVAGSTQQINAQAEQRNVNELVAQYNSDSSKAGTQAQFKDSSLPYKVSPQERVSC